MWPVRLRSLRTPFGTSSFQGILSQCSTWHLPQSYFAQILVISFFRTPFLGKLFLIHSLFMLSKIFSKSMKSMWNGELNSKYYKPAYNMPIKLSRCPLIRRAWWPFFRILAIFPFLHTMRKISDSQHLQIYGKNNCAETEGLARKSFAGEPSKLLPSFLFVEAARIRILWWFSISSRRGGTSPDVIRMRVLVKCSLHFLAVYHHRWKDYY